MRQVRGSLRRRVRSGSAGVVLLALALASLRSASAGTGTREEGDGPAISTGVPAVPEGAPASAPAPSWAPTSPVEAPARSPVIERWWFWTAVAAVGITAFAIVATTSLSNPAAPSTELGNRVAF